MKAALFTLVFGLSTSAFACPNLAGTWTCQYPDGSSDQSTVTQAPLGAGVMYTITTTDGQEQLPADGQTRQVTDDGLAGTLVVNCQADTAVVAVEQVAGAAGSSAAGVTANINLSYTLTAANAMGINATIAVSAPGQAPQNQTQTANCTRN